VSKYEFTGETPLIFGDLHYGVNATVAGVDADGSAVVLSKGDVVETADPISHAFLTLVEEKKTKAATVSAAETPAE
jgi:hypothetical protein